MPKDYVKTEAQVTLETLGISDILETGNVQYDTSVTLLCL